MHPTAAVRGAKGFSALNEDVFSMILSYTDPADAKQLASTCRVAYRLAMPRFLSEVVLGGPTVTDGPKQLTAFSTFMLADLKRVRHLRALELREAAFVAIPEDAQDADSDDEGSDSQHSSWVSDYSCALLLCDVLRATTKLRRLAIWDFEALLASEPIVAESIVGLTRLESASFWFIGKCTMQTLQRTQSLPRQLEFGLWKDGPRMPGDTQALYRYAATLESFDLCEVACLLESLGPDFVAPAVRAMGLGGRIPDFGDIAKAFPGLRAITLFTECSVQDTMPTGYWKHLDVVEAWLPLPFFACSVRRLDLKYALGASTARFVRPVVESRTLQLLAQTTPTVFACTLAAGVTDGEIRRLVAAIPKVRFLDLTLGAPEPDTPDVDSPIHAWLAHFSSVPLEGILLRRARTVHDTEHTAAHLARFVSTVLRGVATVGVALVPPHAPMWFRVNKDKNGFDPLGAQEGAHEHAALLELGAAVPEAASPPRFGSP